jgi:anti-sigma28 factor (negative regulator of flagellin synthesis)
MGMLRDKKCRDKLGRKDDFLTRHTVAEARNAIYQGRYAVDGEKINKMLGNQSLAPVAVGIGA